MIFTYSYHRVELKIKVMLEKTEVIQSALPGFTSPVEWPMRLDLYLCAIIVLTLADRGEKLHFETLFLYFC